MGWLKEKTISIFHFHLLWFGKSLKYCSKTRDFFRNKLLNRYFIEVFSKIIFKWYLKSFCNPLCNIQPIQSEKKIKEESQAQSFFQIFFFDMLSKQENSQGQEWACRWQFLWWGVCYRGLWTKRRRHGRCKGHPKSQRSWPEALRYQDYSGRRSANQERF